MRALVLTLLAAAVWLLPLDSARAGNDRIWSALVLGTQEEPAAPVPEKIKEFVPTLKKIFGYNSFYLLGRKKRDLVDGNEAWLLPSREFFLGVECLQKEETFYRLRIELYRGKELLVSTEAKLARDAPLYIRGPEWGRGQLIFVVEVQ